MSSPAQQPSPALFFETVNAFHRTMGLAAAVRLDLFTAIGEGATTPAAMAKKISVAERGARILCDYLTVIGFLQKNGSSYSLTPDSAVFIDRRSPASLASTLDFLISALNPPMQSLVDDMIAAVRKGGTPKGDEGTLEPENPAWVTFAQAMVPLMRMPAQQIAQLLNTSAGKEMKVLDIAAGHGIFGITIAQQNPKAQIVAADWKNVLQVAQENARKAGVQDRYSTIPGSAFDVEFGSGYDVVLLTNFLHHFDPPTNVQLLKKVHAALKPGGKAVILEFVPNEDRVSPPIPASFVLIMLLGTPSGEAYPFSQFQKMCADAGFSSSELNRMDPAPESIVVATK